MTKARSREMVRRPGLPHVVVQDRLVAVLRSEHPTQLDEAVDVLVDEGFRAIELALTTPGALDKLHRLRRRLGSDVSLGAGTVTSASSAAAAIDAGASFLLAPTVASDACSFAADQGIPFVAGAFTATEALAGWEAGAAAIKLFPAHLLGPEVISALRAPLPDLNFIPTGGIDSEAAASWLRRGAMAVGVGSPLLGDALEGGSLSALRDRSRALRARVAAVTDPDPANLSSGRVE